MTKRISAFLTLAFVVCLVAWLCLGPEWYSPKPPEEFSFNGSNGFLFLAGLIGLCRLAWPLWFSDKPRRTPERTPTVSKQFQLQLTEIETRGPITTHMRIIRVLK